MKGQFKKAFRRDTPKMVMSNVEGVEVPTWYYSPKELIQISKLHFNITNIKPVGICIPPSYLEPYFKNKKNLLNLFIRLERIFDQRIWSNYADHFIITLQKK